MSLPRYPEYKDSAVEWLGEVPAHWKVISIKWLSPVQRGASPRPIDDAKYFDDDGEFAWVRIADVSACDGFLTETTQRLSELGSSLSVKIRPGQLFVSIAGTVGKPCIARIDACIHDGFVYFPLLELDPMFFYRLFEAGVCYGGLGKMGTQLNLNTDTIGSIRVAVPPIDELATVLAFLDRETAKIDGLVAEQRRLIELLREKRQAVISHAVTKGLNPDAPMKPSGIEWLGEVPEHSSVLPLHRLVQSKRRITYGIVQPGTRDESGRFMVRGQDYSFGWANPAEVFKVSDAVEEPYKRARLKARDLLMTIVGAGVGNVGVVPDWLDGANITQTTARIAIEPTLADPNFVASVLRGPIGQRSVEKYAKGAAQPGLNLEHVRIFPVPVPPIDEQIEIARTIERRTRSFDVLTAEAEHAIVLLQERRTALISAAVTGKIEVRGCDEGNRREIA